MNSKISVGFTAIVRRLDLNHGPSRATFWNLDRERVSFTAIANSVKLGSLLETLVKPIGRKYILESFWVQSIA